MSDSPAVHDKWEFYTDLPVGEILRRTRNHYGQSLAEVERILRIRAAHLDALETGETGRLPGRVYAIGFVRAYSEYLGLDGNKMVQLFKLQSGGQGRPELHFPVSAAESRSPGGWVLVISLALVVTIISVWGMMSAAKGPAQEPIPEVPAETSAVVELELPAAVVNAPVPAAAPPAQMFGPSRPAAGPIFGPAPATVTDAAAAPPEGLDLRQAENRVVIRVRERSWVEIRNASDQAILSRILKPGDVYNVPLESGLRLSTGNAGGLIVELNGAPLTGLGGKGGVARGISLDPADLKARQASAAASESPQ